MLRLPTALVEEMIAHSREELPNEACGMVHALDGGSMTLHRVTNAAASPYRYDMAPLEMLKLERLRDERGEALFAIYHSHVASEAWPSPTDVRMAFWPPGEMDGRPMYPDAYYVLVSLAEQPADVRAFRIRPGASVAECIEEEPLEVV